MVRGGEAERGKKTNIQLSAGLHKHPVSPSHVRQALDLFEGSTRMPVESGIISWGKTSWPKTTSFTVVEHHFFGQTSPAQYLQIMDEV
jgi:hypothetical protein